MTYSPTAYILPEVTRQKFTEAVLAQGERLNPYFTQDHPSIPHTNSSDTHAAMRNEMADILIDLLKNDPERDKAQLILEEFGNQRAGKGSKAFTIDNAAIDLELPGTPQSKVDLPVSDKHTFVSEMFQFAVLSAIGQKPYSQRGMQEGNLVTQVIPMPGAKHEQSNRGHGVLALHTEISSTSDQETPEIQTLLGLRGGGNVAPNQRVLTTLVPAQYAYDQLKALGNETGEDYIKLLSKPYYYFSSGPAIAEGHQRLRLAPIISKNNKGEIEFRFHSDPARVQVAGPTTKSMYRRAEAAIDTLRDILDVSSHPELNASGTEIIPGRMLVWRNKELLHGRSDMELLLENAINGEKASCKKVTELFGDEPRSSDPRVLYDEYQENKTALTNVLSGTKPDPRSRWVQRTRGLEDHSSSDKGQQK